MSQQLLEEKLIGCANLIQGMSALYLWKGKIKNSREIVMILKTSAKRAAKLRRRLLEIHPYETPCVAELSLKSLNQAYAAWLKN